MSASFLQRVVASVSTATLVGVALVGALTTPAGADTVGDEATFRTAWATAGTTQIDLTADITLTCVDNEPTRNSTTPIVINGNGYTLSQTCEGDRVLVQESTGSIGLMGLTLTGGSTKGDGGGINTSGNVSLLGTRITGNHALGEGGAIEVDGDGRIDVADSVISDNVADGSGGALAVQGLTTLSSSTVSGNTSGNNGGAVRAYGGALVINSTVSGNTADGGGGAISSNIDIDLVYATVTDNTAVGGGNLELDGTLNAFGSVVALPHGSTNCSGSTTVSTGYNVDDDGSCGFGAGPGDQSDVAGSLGLGALADNGGNAPTQLPSASSPLLDQIPAACGGGMDVTTDERGVTRPQGGLCDIGAVEVAVVGPTTTTTPPATTPTPVEAAPAFTG